MITKAFIKIMIPTLLFALTSIHTSMAQPWWVSETTMDEKAQIDLTQKSWWTKASALQAGEQFILRSDFDDTKMMIVKCEARQRNPQQNMLVWIIDDDEDMDSQNPKEDRDSDCYVVDYGCDGMVDRMVDYINDDTDSTPDEMEIRYFIDGSLRRAWFGVDLDDDGQMWDLIDYEYSGDFFKSDPYGNNLIFMNKYNPHSHSWVPISECPFSFYDIDDDNQSETVVRFSAAPLQFDPNIDPDYANSRARYEGRYDSSMEHIGVVNIRYSFDIDGLSSNESPLHYEMGFNMIGEQPYQYKNMERTNSLRRPPSTAVCIRWDEVREVADNYPAQQTGFSWMEFSDASLRIGHPSLPQANRRWEGVFWTWHRRIMHNTGGPVQYWNMRREFCGHETSQRELYYSPVDHRIHLKYATEGWLKIGSIEGNEMIGEVRMYDTNEDGYFDRWEYYENNQAMPYRTSSVTNAQNQDLNDLKEITEFYNQKIIPNAIQQNKQLIECIKQVPILNNKSIPNFYQSALTQATSPGEKRYILDLIREYWYRQFQNDAREYAALYFKNERNMNTRRSTEQREQSKTAWTYSKQLSNIDALYAKGKFDQAATLFESFNDTYPEHFYMLHNTN